MGKILTTEITAFTGMTNDLRWNDKSADCALCMHFDLFRNRTLAPNRTYTTITNGSEKITRFAYAKQGSNTNYAIYGMGDAGGISGGTSGYPGVYYKAPTATVWTDGVAMANGNLANNVFALFKDSLYGWQASGAATTYRYLWRVSGLATSLSVTDGLLDLGAGTTATNLAPPVHHPLDDYLYIFYDNLVRRLTDATTVSGVLLTLPSNMKIVGGASYRQYLAIVCSPIQSGTENSILYIWDRDSSLTTLTDKIDLGPGTVTYVEASDDGGVWIVQENNSAVLGFSTFNNELQVKYFNGQLFTFSLPNGSENEYFSTARTIGSTYLPIANSIQTQNAFYFPAQIITRLAAETRNVIFAARMTSKGIELICDQEITAVGGAGTNYINGIFEVGNHFLVSYGSAGTPLTEQTVSGSTYQTSVYESRIFALGDSGITKKLVGVTLFSSPLPAAATMSLYYRLNAQTSWTLIFTDSTDDDISHSAINIESSGATLPEFKEIQFKIESTGGAEITGFRFKSELIDKEPY